MHSRTVFLIAGMMIAAASAGAQTVDDGTAVRVNPMAAGGNVLLYPGGQYMRVVPPLLQPGQANGPIQLHLPTKHRTRATTGESVAQGPPPEAQPNEPKAARQRKSKTVASAAPEQQAPIPEGYQPFTGPAGAASLFGFAPPPAAPAHAAAPPPAPAPKPAAKANTQLARAEPAPVQTAMPGLSKRSVILFAHDAPDPAELAQGDLKFLATALNAAMTGPASRIQILAYGGAKGDKGSDARRLSLKRALAIRQVLIDDGVAPERIDVRAMGGVDDSGPADRVDVYVKA